MAALHTPGDAPRTAEQLAEDLQAGKLTDSELRTICQAQPDLARQLVALSLGIGVNRNGAPGAGAGLLHTDGAAVAGARL